MRRVSRAPSPSTHARTHARIDAHARHSCHPLQANDVYAIVNAIPAMALCLYGFLTPGLGGSVAFGAGLGITLFGIMYMFIHGGVLQESCVRECVGWRVCELVGV